MSCYPVSESDQRIPAADLRALVIQIWERCGMADADAALLADTLVAADLRGVHSHGVLRVPEYVKKLVNGGVDPKGRPSVAADNGTTIVVDGGNSMGQIGAEFAMREAIGRARRHNIAAAAVRGSNHCGAMAYFAMQALPEDMIGIATTNALPTMAPWGGAERVVGINPLAVAIPAGEEPAIVLDAAFSGSSHGKIRVFHQMGAAIPSNWAFDAQGRPTTDPAVAIEGLLQPIGEYKGVGLALVMGILSSLLSGAAYGTESGDMENGPKPGCDGHFFLALRVAGFEDPARFKGRVDGIIREMRASRRAAGVDRLYSPGELETETDQRYQSGGIPLNNATLSGIADAARSVGITALPWGG
jgi:LDH2 family malate/lactate/ureidoglycolate dehydrogenase